MRTPPLPAANETEMFPGLQNSGWCTPLTPTNHYNKLVAATVDTQRRLEHIPSAVRACLSIVDQLLILC